MVQRVLVAVVAGGLCLAALTARAETPRARIAILPIVVHTLEERAYLQTGLSDMLATRIGQFPQVAVVRVEDISQATTDVEKAKQAGAAVGAEFVLFGAFTQFGEGASLDVQCVSLRNQNGDSTNARRVFIQSGTVGEIIPQLETLAQKVSLFMAGDLDPTPAVAAGPSARSNGNGNGAGSGEVEELRRRVEALEEFLYGTEPATPSEADEPDSEDLYGAQTP